MRRERLNKEAKEWLLLMLQISEEDRDMLDALKDDKL